MRPEEDPSCELSLKSWFGYVDARQKNMLLTLIEDVTEIFTFPLCLPGLSMSHFKKWNEMKKYFIYPKGKLD